MSKWDRVSAYLNRKIGRTAHAYRSVFDEANPEARIVLADLLTVGLYEESVFVEGHADTTAYNLGAQDVVRRIVKMAHLTPDEVTRIANEQRRVEAALERDPYMEEDLDAA